MTKVTLLSVVMFLTLALYVNSALTANTDEYPSDGKKREEETNYSPIWFGPRIGRRKRNPSENIFKSLDREELEKYSGLLKTPWSLLTPTGGKRELDFTPRLGRDSGEQDDLDYLDFVRRKPFTPRLGRRLSPYSPRLGRENDILLQ